MPGREATVNPSALATNSAPPFTPGIWRRYLKDLTYRLVAINGEAGLVSLDGSRPMSVLTLDTDGLRIPVAYSAVNPDRFARANFSCFRRVLDHGDAWLVDVGDGLHFCTFSPC